MPSESLDLMASWLQLMIDNHIGDTFTGYIELSNADRPQARFLRVHCAEKQFLITVEEVV